MFENFFTARGHFLKRNVKGGGIYSFELPSTKKHSMHRFLKSTFKMFSSNTEWCYLLQRLSVILMAVTEVKLASVSFPLNSVVLFFWCLYKHTKSKCFLSWNKNVFIVCYYRTPFFSFKFKQIWEHILCQPPSPPNLSVIWDAAWWPPLSRWKSAACLHGS